jgi:hypothetical protein
MPIKVVCFTKTDGVTQERVILEKATSPANMIAVADRFLTLHREHGIANGEQFVGLSCYLDDKLIQTRLLIECASTAFHLLRQRMFGDCGFTIYKHEPDVKQFMQMIMAGAQPTYFAPPFWTGKLRKSSPPKSGAKAGKGDDADESSDEAILTAISKQTKVAVEEPAPAVVAPVETVQPKGPRKMSAGNLGALGQVGGKTA